MGFNPEIETRRYAAVTRRVSLVLLLFILGCVAATPPADPRYESGRPPNGRAESRSNADAIERLERDLIKLVGYPAEETAILAETAVSGAKSLAGQYEARHSGKFQNFMILLGLRDRGLCCHWTRDLLDLLNPLELQHFRLFWAVSGYATYREHSSIVVTAAEKPFASGIVLDAWRNGGDLFWTDVASDVYEWHRHPEDDGTTTIICEMDQKN